MPKKVTLQMIADAAGYSKYVVSKTLNNQTGVKESTRERILFVAKQLGYYKTSEYNAKTITSENENQGFVLVVMPNIRQQNVESFYWSSVFNGIVDYLEELEVSVIVISNHDNLVEQIKGDSLIGVVTVGFVSTQMLLQLSDYDVPLVMVDHEDPLVKADRIFMDNITGIQLMANHLMGLGHTRICFVGDIDFSPSFKDRWIGFRTALENNQLLVTKDSLFDFNYKEKISQQLTERVRRWQNNKNMPTALVCANDQIATTLIEVLSVHNISVPEDVSVTGFDNIKCKSNINPELTTIHVLKETIGRRAVSMLLWRIKNKQYPTEKIQMSCEVVIRSSVTSPSDGIQIKK
ncbi:LacI family DNA-binding transcriptional regulator [Gracilibacillus kekensis]|uniref:Transcriptional regulator, LacI family n=1 Tax=Gracilibacillus kekensis TaxID=1027249 RepID=A0A1M7JZF8_9BACI|nr:LacI family DNA-binding transcriptional regulator [Gracilibacillus kekensis]SHM58406.1 transcriptional regulator, LacI family [Gracilibacillus kekensis]